MSKIGIMVVMDPRLDPVLRERLIGDLRVKERFQEIGVETICAAEAVTDELSARREAERMRNEGAAGVVYCTAWFLRANAVIAACRKSGLPALVWAIPDINNAALIGFGVTHGALDEVGIRHEIVCGPWDETARRKLQAWSAACAVKQAAETARYGQIGGLSLSMVPTDTDANQWRRMFGIDVDHAEQWTLIKAAEEIPSGPAQSLAQSWKKEFASVEVSDRVLERSARLYLAGQEMFAANRWDFAGIKCQFELIDNYCAPCLPVALWNDDGFTVACESDMNAALTMYVLRLITGSPVMFSDIQYLDREERWARFLNCGTAATLLAGGKEHVSLTNCPQVQSTFDEATGRYRCQGGACTHFLLPPGPVTLARFGRIEGEYVLHAVEGESFAHPHDKAELMGIAGVWPFAYVRIKNDMDDFIRNLRAHHMCIVPGNRLPELESLARLWNVRML